MQFWLMQPALCLNSRVGSLCYNKFYAKRKKRTLPTQIGYAIASVTPRPRPNLPRPNLPRPHRD